MGSRLTPAELSARGRMGAHAKHARHDSHEHAAKMRAGFDKRFLDEVDPNRELPEEERERRAAHARKLYFQKLAWKSAQARRKKAADAAASDAA